MNRQFIGVDNPEVVQDNVYDSYYNEPEGIKDDMFYIHNQWKESPFQDKNMNQEVLTKKTTLLPLNSRNRDKNRYPNANNIVYELPRSYSNVAKIELVSSIFPNADHVIKGETSGSLQNNKVRWTNQNDKYFVIYQNIEYTFAGGQYFGFLFNYTTDRSTEAIFINELFCFVTVNCTRSLANDGTPSTLVSFVWEDIGTFTSNTTTGLIEYSVDIKPGNYAFDDIMDTITSGINSVRKIDGEINFMVIDFDRSTDIISASPYILFVLPENPLSTIRNEYTVNINIPNHFFSTGEIVRLVDVSSVGGIPAEILNNEYRVTFIDANNIQITTNTKATSTTTGGGLNAKAGELTSFKFLFGDRDRYSNTSRGFISNILGFRNENSGEVLGEDPLTTQTITPSFVVDQGNDVWRFNTNDDTTFLRPCVSSDITSLSGGTLETVTDHNFCENGMVFLTVPSINYRGYVFATVIGRRRLQLGDPNLNASDVTGATVKYGDTVQLHDIQLNPLGVYRQLELDNNLDTYFVHNVGLNNVDLLLPGVDSVTLTEDSRIYTEYLSVDHQSHLFTGVDHFRNNFSKVTEIAGNNYFECRFLNDVSYIGGKSGNNIGNITVSSGVITFEAVFTPVLDSSVNVVSFVFIDNGGGLETPWITGTRVSGNTFTGTVDLPDAVYPAGSTTIVTGNSVLLKGLHQCCVKPGNTTSVINDSSVSPVHCYDGIYNIISNTSDPYTLRFYPYLSRGGSLYGADTIGGTCYFDTVFNEIQLYNVQYPNPRAEIGGVNLDAINSDTNTIRLDDDNNDGYFIKVRRKYFRTPSRESFGKDRVFVSSEIHGFGQNRSNTEFWFKTGDLFGAVNLRGEDYVFLMTNPMSNSSIKSGRSSNTDIFAQILLDTSPGVVSFNSFITEPLDFTDNLIKTFSRLFVSVEYDNGVMFDLKNLDYSITLKVTEYIKTIASIATQNNLTRDEIEILNSRR